MEIREPEFGETELLKDFLYEAIYIPKGIEPPAREIIKEPELQVYIDCFGFLQGDYCLLAEEDGKVIGAVWSRIMNDYGHVDDDTPSLAISLYKEYRGKGYGTRLMKKMLLLLKKEGYKQVSLAVWKENPAVKLYEKTGFKTIADKGEEYIMVCPLEDYEE